MNLAFKIMAFSILLNISIGIMMNTVTDSGGCAIFGDNVNASCYDPTRIAGLQADDNYMTGFISDMNQTVSPTGLLEDKGNAVYRVLDMMNLGFIQRILGTVTQYMYGFVTLLERILGDYLEPAAYNFLFRPGGLPVGLLYNIMTFIYIMAAISLWTGKNYND